MPKITKKSPGPLGWRHNGVMQVINCGSQGVGVDEWATAMKIPSIAARVERGDIVVELDRVEVTTQPDAPLTAPEVPTESDAEAELPLPETVNDVSPSQPDEPPRRRTRHG